MSDPILDRPLTADAVYDLFVNQAAGLYAAVASWYRDAHGVEAAPSDIQHGVYRSFESQQFSSRWGTMRRALQNTWPIAGPTQPPGTLEPLHVEGTTFRTASGQLFQWRGYSMFLAYRRFLAGEDLRPDLATLRGNGINMLRVFGPLDWRETPDYDFPHFRTDRLGEFFAMLASEGFYCEFVIGCYLFGEAPTQWLFAQQIFNIACQHHNVLIEAVNEPSVGSKPDPIDMLTGVNRYGVLTSYGYYASYYARPSVFPPVLDYGTVHIQRDAAWHRKARHAQELQHHTGKPWISDEPAKITETGFSYPGGKNDPIATPREAAWHFGVCCLWTPGGTVHTEEGKWGRVPTPGMLQYTVLETVSRDVWQHIGPGWQTGEYNHSENNDSPVDDVDEPDGDPIWTYTSLHADEGLALSVRCGVSKPEPKNGWRAVEYWGEGSAFVQLERP